MNLSIANQIRVLVAAFALFFGAALLEAEENRIALSLDDFVELVTKNDAVFEQILIDQLSLKYSKEIGLPARDLILAARQNYTLSLDGASEGVETQISLNKLFPLLGTEVAVSYQTRGLGRR